MFRLATLAVLAASTNAIWLMQEETTEDVAVDNDVADEVADEATEENTDDNRAVVEAAIAASADNIISFQDVSATGATPLPPPEPVEVPEGAPITDITIVDDMV